MYVSHALEMVSLVLYMIQVISRNNKRACYTYVPYLKEIELEGATLPASHKVSTYLNAYA